MALFLTTVQPAGLEWRFCCGKWLRRCFRLLGVSKRVSQMPLTKRKYPRFKRERKSSHEERLELNGGHRPGRLPAHARTPVSACGGRLLNKGRRRSQTIDAFHSSALVVLKNAAQISRNPGRAVGSILKSIGTINYLTSHHCGGSAAGTAHEQTLPSSRMCSFCSRAAPVWAHAGLFFKQCV